MISIRKHEDILPSGESNGSSEGNGIGFCAGVGEADELDARDAKSIGDLNLSDIFLEL